MENHSYLLKPDDVISIRGYGKFIYKGIEYTTKKPSCCTAFKIYLNLLYWPNNPAKNDCVFCHLC